MINLADSLLVARAKLKLHPVTTIISALIISLLFGALIFISLISTGFIDTAEQLSSSNEVIVRLINVNGDYPSNTAKLNIHPIEKMTSDYRPKSIYQAKNYILSSAQGAFNIIKDGKEVDSLAEMQKTNDPDKLDKFESIANFVTIYPDDLVKRYKFADSAWNPASNRIPIILSSEQAAGLLNTQKPADMRTASKK